MSVAVALATYNGARHLPEFLDSLENQSPLLAELVVGDDGSADGSLDLVRAVSECERIPVDGRLLFRTSPPRGLPRDGMGHR